MILRLKSFLCLPSSIGGVRPTDRQLNILDEAIQVKSDADNVVYDYLLTVKETCGYPLVSLWVPEELIRCENQYREYVLLTLKNNTMYGEFTTNISPRFRRKSLELLTQVQVIFYLFQ